MSLTTALAWSLMVCKKWCCCGCNRILRFRSCSASPASDPSPYRRCPGPSGGAWLRYSGRYRVLPATSAVAEREKPGPSFPIWGH